MMRIIKNFCYVSITTLTIPGYLFCKFVGFVIHILWVGFRDGWDIVVYKE